MSNFPILDLVIGMTFLYFLLSIICSAGVEIWLTVRRTRARLLEQWLKAVFNLPALDARGMPLINEEGKSVVVGQAIMDHCMTIALSPRGKSNSYLGSVNFTNALLDKISITNDFNIEFDFVEPPKDLDAFIENIKRTKVISAELKRTFLLFAYEAKQTTSPTKPNLLNNATGVNQTAAAPVAKPTEGGSNAVGIPEDSVGAPDAVQVPSSMDANTSTASNVYTYSAGNIQMKSELEVFRDIIQNWYNLNGERLTGTMKRRTMPATILMAILLTVGLNVDSIKVAKYFYISKDAAKFSDIVSGANNTTPGGNVLPQTLPIGDGADRDLKDRFFGWIATILAIVLGAPFWFDTLNKFVNLRNTGPRPQDLEGFTKRALPNI